MPVVARNPEGTYLLGPNHAVLEVAANPPAALALAVWRRETFLSRTKEKARDLDMRLVQARIKGDFVDLTSMSPDMTRDQRWALGSELYTEGTHGAIFTRPDFPGASFLAVFDGSVLQPDVPGAHYRFAWDGAVVRSIYDYNRNAGNRSAGVTCSRLQVTLPIKPPSTICRARSDGLRGCIGTDRYYDKRALCCRFDRSAGNGSLRLCSPVFDRGYGRQPLDIPSRRPGQPKLDATALRTVRLSGPFDPPPQQMTVAIAVALGRKL